MGLHKDKIYCLSHRHMASSVWRKRVTMATRLAERDGGWVCTYTGIPLVPAGKEAEYCTAVELPKGRIEYRIPEDANLSFFHFDHVIPRSQGGKFEFSNLVLAAVSANKARGDRPIEDMFDRPIECIQGKAVGSVSANLNEKDIIAFMLIEGHAHLESRAEIARYAVRFLADLILSGEIWDLPDLREFPTAIVDFD